MTIRISPAITDTGGAVISPFPSKTTLQGRSYLTADRGEGLQTYEILNHPSPKDLVVFECCHHAIKRAELTAYLTQCPHCQHQGPFEYTAQNTAQVLRDFVWNRTTLIIGIAVVFFGVIANLLGES